MNLTIESSIHELDVSSRAANCFSTMNLETIGELCSKTPRDLMRTRNLGKGTVKEIRAALKVHGLDLATPDPDERIEKLKDQVHHLKVQLDAQERYVKYLEHQLEQTQTALERRTAPPAPGDPVNQCPVQPQSAA